MNWKFYSRKNTITKKYNTTLKHEVYLLNRALFPIPCDSILAAFTVLVEKRFKLLRRWSNLRQLQIKIVSLWKEIPVVIILQIFESFNLFPLNSFNLFFKNIHLYFLNLNFLQKSSCLSDMTFLHLFAFTQTSFTKRKFLMSFLQQTKLTGI